ncbi:MAG: hypothetical protein JSS76_19685 [Bacteroidetes bacterium]|nr:hypothetical protein [Bacteroidota bacterium]
MNHLWKLICATAFAAVLLSSCKKNEAVTKAEPLTLQRLVQNVIGTYTVTQYCSYGSGAGGYTYDTVTAPLVISTSDNASIIMNGTQLHFAGNLDSMRYDFYAPASGGGYNAQFDSGGHSIYFGYHNGGMGGGSSCWGSGTK